MRTKRIKIPMFIDLGCNHKAYAIVTPKGEAMLLSYETPIAYGRIESGTSRTMYRLYDKDAMSNTTLRHWNAFVRWAGIPKLTGKENYMKLPYARCV